MSGTLAFIGGSEFDPACSFDEALFPSGSEVLLLPTARAYEAPQHTVAAAAAHFAAWGAALDAVDAFSRADADDERIVQRVRAADHVYVTGGSPMHLRATLKDTALLGALVEVWQGGGTVAVAAEAAAVLCSHMVDSRGGAFTVGLGLVTTMTVIPQLNRWSPDKLHRTVRLAPADLVVVGIDEATAVVRGPDGAWRTEGAGKVHVFQGGREVELRHLPHALNPDAGF